MATAAPRVLFRTLATLCRARAILPRSVTIAVNCRNSLVVAQPLRASLIDCRRTSLISTKRWYASDHPEITEKDIQDRTLTVVKLFDKVNPDKVTLEAHFLNDLGLDSLDAVEIVMAFEDEFGIEISDEEAEKIFTCNDAVELLKVKFDVH